MTDRERRTAALTQAREGLARAAGLSGWTLGVESKHLDPPPPWDYEAIARERASHARRVLDLGTGGGERLAGIIAGLSSVP